MSLQPAGVPSIHISTEFSSPSDPVSPSHNHVQSGLLSPARHNFSPSSPTASDLSDAGSIPPSPTLSSHSTNYATTLILRDNKPDEKFGASGHLEPAGISTQRRTSNATSISDTDGETFRSATIQYISSAATSATNVDLSVSENQTPSVPPVDNKDKSRKKKKTGDSADDSLTAHQRELAQDESIDPSPFRFKPFQLAHLLDPKSFQTLVAFGGIDGIIRGLGTHAERGLTTEPSTEKPRLGAGEGVSNRHDSEKALQSPSSGAGEMSEKVPNITLTEPSGNDATPTSGDDDTPHTGTMGDRRRVYGENILPTRISKTLLQLMAAAMKDKVLVCNGFSWLAFGVPRLTYWSDPAFRCRCDFFSSRPFPRFWHT